MTNTNKCFILNKKQNICSLNKKEIDMEKDDKLKALDAALSQIEKQYGKGAVMKLGDPTAQMNVETIPTGSLSLDIALGLGGIPKGRIIEIYGPESSGLRITEHYTYLLTQLVDKDNRTVGLADHSGQLAQRLGHQSCL